MIQVDNAEKFDKILMAAIDRADQTLKLICSNPDNSPIWTQETNSCVQELYLWS